MPTQAPTVMVADAAVAHILTVHAATPLSQDVKPVRSYADWDLNLDGLDLLEDRESDKLHIDIVAHTTEQKCELADRGGSLELSVPVDVAIRKKFGTDKQNDDTGRIELKHIDALELLTHEVFALFMPLRLTGINDITWDGEAGGTRIVVSPMKQHLRMRQYTSIVRIFFRVYL